MMSVCNCRYKIMYFVCFCFAEYLVFLTFKYHPITFWIIYMTTEFECWLLVKVEARFESMRI